LPLVDIVSGFFIESFKKLNKKVVKDYSYWSITRNQERQQKYSEEL